MLEALFDSIGQLYVGVSGSAVDVVTASPVKIRMQIDAGGIVLCELET